MSELSHLVGMRIKELREAMGLSQADFSVVAKLSRAYIGQVETGRKSLTLDSLIKITDALEISLSDFFSSIKSEWLNNTDASNFYRKLLSLTKKEQIDFLQIITIIENWGKT